MASAKRCGGLVSSLLRIARAPAPRLRTPLPRPRPDLPGTQQLLTRAFSFPIPKPPPPSGAAGKKIEPHYMLSFTCVPCGSQSRHSVSKQGYHYGSVLIACPTCRNRHIISDHLRIFGERDITVEDLMRERGRLVKRGHLGDDGDLEFWEDGTVTPRDSTQAASSRGDQQSATGEEGGEGGAAVVDEARDPSAQSPDPPGDSSGVARGSHMSSKNAYSSRFVPGIKRSFSTSYSGMGSRGPFKEDSIAVLKDRTGKARSQIYPPPLIKYHRSEDPRRGGTARIDLDAPGLRIKYEVSTSIRPYRFPTGKTGSERLQKSHVARPAVHASYDGRHIDGLAKDTEESSLPITDNNTGKREGPPRRPPQDMTNVLGKQVMVRKVYSAFSEKNLDQLAEGAAQQEKRWKPWRMADLHIL